MSVFTPKEIEYLRGQPLGRVTTVNAAGEPWGIDTEAYWPNSRSVAASERPGAA